jgi:hydroxymethylpyrimidine/phosphomethylpyrimidine kinase
MVCSEDFSPSFLIARERTEVLTTNLIERTEVLTTNLIERTEVLTTNQIERTEVLTTNQRMINRLLLQSVQNLAAEYFQL